MLENMKKSLLDIYTSIDNRIPNINIIEVEMKLLHNNFKDGTWKLPEKGTDFSSGYDLLAAIDEPIQIPKYSSQLIPTGLSIWVKDPNFMITLHPRSGLGCKKGLILGNTTGIIDSDYQGPLLICAYNRTDTSIEINPGEYIAQMILVPRYDMLFIVSETFSNETTRGENGFGHTSNRTK